MLCQTQYAIMQRLLEAAQCHEIHLESYYSSHGIKQLELLT